MGNPSVTVSEQPLPISDIPSRILRVNNVARRLHKPERTIRHLAATNRLPAFKIDRKSWAFRSKDVELYKRLMEERDAEDY